MHKFKCNYYMLLLEVSVCYLRFANSTLIRLPTCVIRYLECNYYMLLLEVSVCYLRFANSTLIRLPTCVIRYLVPCLCSVGATMMIRTKQRRQTHSTMERDKYEGPEDVFPLPPSSFAPFYVTRSLKKLYKRGPGSI
jgi:hypothetical protein